MCDAYGISLAADVARDDSWTRQHDFIKDAIVMLLQKAGIRAHPEVAGIFLSLLPQHRLEDLPVGFFHQWRGYVPDIVSRLRQQTEGGGLSEADRLLELKTIQLGPTHYPGSGQTRSARRGTDRRADRINKDIENALAALDAQFFDSPPDAVGPLVSRLREHGRVLGLVFGGMGEASQDVSAVVAAIASQTVTAHAHRHGRTFSETALADASRLARQRIALAAHRARATMRLDRLDLLVRSTDAFGDAAAAWAPHRKVPPSHRAAFDFLLEARSHGSSARAARACHVRARA